MSSRYIGYCPTIGKRMYTTRRDARDAARNDGIVSEDLRPWKCEHCGFFHLGHGYGLTRAEHRHLEQSRREEAPEPVLVSGRFTASGVDAMRVVTSMLREANFVVAVRDEDGPEALAVVELLGEDSLSVDVSAVPPWRLDDVADALSAMVESGVSVTGAVYSYDSHSSPLARVAAFGTNIVWQHPVLGWRNN